MSVRAPGTASRNPSGGSSARAAARSSASWLRSESSAAPSHSLRSSGNRGQLPTARLRKQHGGDEEDRVRGSGEDADGTAQRHGRRQEPDHGRKQRAHAAAEVVAEALAGAADARREQLGEKGSHSAEDPAGEERSEERRVG